MVRNGKKQAIDIELNHDDHIDLEHGELVHGDHCNLNHVDLNQGGKSWQPFGKNGHRIFVRRVFPIFARSWKFANLIQHDIYYIPCDRALLAQEKLFLPLKKNNFFAKSLPKSA